MSLIHIAPIHNDSDLQRALSQISELMNLDPESQTKEADLLEVLSTLVEAYEAKNFAIAEPDPIEAVKFRMDQLGLSIKDMEPIIGSPNRVYEVLSKKRPLTLRMIRNLSRTLGIPAQVLIL